MSKHVQLVFLGAPGSGKGTQAKLLKDKHSFYHVSTGDLLRAEIAKGSELGSKLEDILKAGQLVDNDTVLELLKENCKVDDGTYIFDGYPRNIEQAKCLDQAVLGDDCPKKAIYFEVNADKLVDRLTNRRICKRCGEIWNLKTKPVKNTGECDKCGGELMHRSDDREEVIRDRLSVFEKEIDPILTYYKDQGVLLTLDAMQDIENIGGQIVESIK